MILVMSILIWRNEEEMTMIMKEEMKITNNDNNNDNENDNESEENRQW